MSPVSKRSVQVKWHPVSDYMTTNPTTVQVDLPVNQGLAQMRAQRIHHLPVMDGKELVGVVRESDLQAAVAIFDQLPLKCGDVARSGSLTTAPTTPMKLVVRRMSEEKLDSVVVQAPDGAIIGIFTSTDAVSILDALLNRGGD